MLIRQVHRKIVALASYFSSRADDYDGLYDAVVKINHHAESSVDPQEWFNHAFKMYPEQFDSTSSIISHHLIHSISIFVSISLRPCMDN